MASSGGTGRLLFSTTTNVLFSRSLLSTICMPPFSSPLYLRFPKPLSLSTATATSTTAPERTQTLRHAILLDRIRSRHLKAPSSPNLAGDARKKEEVRMGPKATCFEDLGFNEEVLSALKEMNISVPTEIQYIGVPAMMQGRSVVLGSHTGSGKTLAYLLPLVQLLRNDEAVSGRIMKPRRPRAVVLCPTRELCEQVFRVAKSISHHARFRSTMISGGGRLRPQEDSLNQPIDMVVGTPGRLLKHIEDGNMVYGDIKYLVLDEADTMFDRGFGPDIRKFIGPLKTRALKPDDQGFQTILVTATMTKGVQSLVDEEFKGITHLRTSSLHKKIANARHDFIKLSGSENKLEALLQVLEPSLERGNRVMVFCNTLNSSRAVDHFLSENQISTVNYHGEVPAEQRVINLNKFKSDEGDCPTLVCTDLAARGLDLDVDHVIMFDFPKNSIDYLHRTGRTARMGAKGKVTSLVSKKDCLLATRIEEGIKKNESLESFNEGNVRMNQNNVSKSAQVINSARNTNITSVSRKNANVSRVADPKKMGLVSSKSSTVGKRTRTATSVLSRKTQTTRTTKSSPVGTSRSRKVGPSKSSKTFAGGSKEKSAKDNKRAASRKFALLRSKLSVVGFRGRSSSLKKQTVGPN